MYGNSLHAKDRQGSKRYEYHQYICSTYANRNGPSNATCGRNPVNAARVLAWIVRALQKRYLGPGRAALVREIQGQLQREAKPKAGAGDVERLQRKAADLEREIGRLVKAIRTIDAAELVEELALVKAERARLVDEITQASRLATPLDVDAEAERLADTLRDLAEPLRAP
jgi:hypothetical protein